MAQNYINHIALVLDASLSMTPRVRDVIKVADDQIAYLARRSQELDQETRITVYVFNETAKCVIYDKDVLRLPSIASFYHASGNTALVDATLLSQEDLALTPEKYGDHAFLTYVITDGEDNRSRRSPQLLSTRLAELPDHWTVAVLVPDQRAKHEAKRFGFPADNIAIWDTTSSSGIYEAGDTIRRATDTFMVNRAQGIRGSRAMFSTGSDAVNRRTVSSLNVLPRTSYKLLPVGWTSEIREFVEENGMSYRVGQSFYQLSKTETIQRRKNIAVMEKASGKVYTGDQARQIIGLPDNDTRVKPSFNPEYDVFVQSTSVNRKLIPGTKLLVLT